MLLSAEHLSINFGSRQLLDDVNFYLNEGDKVGVIGINGTGKSTFLKVLSGVTEPDGGTISRNPNVQVSLLPQNPAMEESATVLEQVFLHFPAEFRELNEYEAKAMLNRLGITDFAQKVGTLSGGQRKRVALAAALIHPADVLILDEPTAGLDPNERIRFRNLISELSEDRIVLLSTHIVSDIEYIASEILLMKDGRITLSGTAEEVIASMPERVWLFSVPKEQVDRYLAAYRVSNLKTTPAGATLRVLSAECPAIGAVETAATLEDVFLHYFGESAGDSDGTV